MLHFLSPQESGINEATAPRDRCVKALPREAMAWPFRVSLADTGVNLAEVARYPAPAQESDHAFIS